MDVLKDIICFKRKLEKKGILLSATGILGSYFGFIDKEENILLKLDDFIYALENSWSNKNFDISEKASEIFGVDLKRIGIIRDVDYFKALIEDICETCNIKRIVLLFDEACHNFIPLQQREFLRCLEIYDVLLLVAKQQYIQV